MRAFPRRRRSASSPAESRSYIDTNGKSTKKPASREENGFEFRPLGMGMQNFDAILKACEESGTELVIVEQDRVYDGMSEVEAAKISKEYLKNRFGH